MDTYFKEEELTPASSSVATETINTFASSGLKPQILKAVSELGFETPTPIQQQAIPVILESGADLIALAQTGTGKTGAFGLPLIHKINPLKRNVQAIVLSPTRELAIQITKDFENYSKYLPEVRVAAVYGGASMVNQIRDIKGGAQIVVGTPGRVVDLINRGALNLNFVNMLVLDEADEMLNMGFKDSIDTILDETPAERQTLLFSATMPKEIIAIANNYMQSPAKIEVGKRNQGAENIEHDYYVVNARDRYEALKRICDMNPQIYGIVFCRTRKETKEVSDQLMQDGYNADALYGDLTQAQRDFVMNRFRQKTLQILVATDVAARGLDVNDLTHVINYNLPDDLEAYVHRSGRTGRAGRQGISISIVHSKELNKIRDLERTIRKPFERKMVPSGSEICEIQLFKLIDKIEKIEVDEKQIEPYLETIYAKLEWLSREQLIQHFVSAEFNRFLDYYRNAPDLNVRKTDRNDSRFERNDRFETRNRFERNDRNDRSFGNDRYDRNDRNDRSDRGRGDWAEDRSDSGERRSRFNGSYSRFHINLGSKNSLTAQRLMGLINDATRTRNIQIGKIDIMRNFSFFEIDSQYESELMKTFKEIEFDNVQAMISVAKPEPTHIGRKPDFQPSGPSESGRKKRIVRR